MQITVEMVMQERPCVDYPESRVRELWSGRESLSPSDVAALDIPFSDRAWLLGRILGHNDKTRVVVRRIVRDALGDMEIPDAYKLWLDSGDKSLRNAARDAAWSADWKSDWYSVATITRDATWFSDKDVAWYTAGSASVYYGSSTWGKYLGWMVEFLEDIK